MKAATSRLYIELQVVAIQDQSTRALCNVVTATIHLAEVTKQVIVR